MTDPKYVVASEVPFELWLHIAELAATRPWSRNQFHPPKYDLHCLKGFGTTCRLFREIIIILSSHEFTIETKRTSEFLEVGEDIIRKAKCLHITINSPTPMKTITFDNQFKKFCQLLSMTIHCVGLIQPLFFQVCDLLSLPNFSSLQRLDITFWRPEILYRMLITYNISLPSLVELRLKHEGDPEPIDRYIPSQDLIDCLSRFLSPLTNLQHFSIHGSLDSNLAFNTQCQIHSTSFFHLEPSEGYERHFADCPLCKLDYNFRLVELKEVMSTLELAKRHPVLERVSWANLWRRTRSDENGQRRLAITRRDSIIEISIET